MRIIQPQCSTEIGKISVENSIPTYNGIVLKFYGDSIFQSNIVSNIDSPNVTYLNDVGFHTFLLTIITFFSNYLKLTLRSVFACLNIL